MLAAAVLEDIAYNSYLLFIFFFFVGKWGMCFVDFNLSNVSLLFFSISEGNEDLQFCFSPPSVVF